MLPNEAVLISDGDRIDFELTESFGSGRIVFGAGVGAASEAGWQATVAAGAQAGEAAAQGLAGAHFGAAAAQGVAGAHFGAQGLQAGAHFGAQGLHALQAGAPQPQV